MLYGLASAREAERRMRKSYQKESVDQHSNFLWSTTILRSTWKDIQSSEQNKIPTILLQRILSSLFPRLFY